MGKLIQISVELWLEKVSAPAAEFSAEDVAYLEVEMLGKRMTTTETILNFPIIFDQRINFKRAYKHATIMRAVEHVYRKTKGETEGQIVARFDGTTGNTLLSGDLSKPAGCSDDRSSEQAVDMRTCVEGFCFRPQLKFSSFVTLRELAMPREEVEEVPVSKTKLFVAGAEAKSSKNADGIKRDVDGCENKDIEKYQEVLKQMEEIVNRMQPAGQTLGPTAGRQGQAGGRTTNQQPGQMSLPRLQDNNRVQPPGQQGQSTLGNSRVDNSPETKISDHLARSRTRIITPGKSISLPDSREVASEVNFCDDRPPFVVRRVDSNLFKRTAKFHKTMSQETNLMLMHYQLDHPSDQELQKVLPGHVPVPLYKKLRKEYEERRARINRAKKKKSCIPRKQRLKEQVPHLRVVTEPNAETAENDPPSVYPVSNADGQEQKPKDDANDPHAGEYEVDEETLVKRLFQKSTSAGNLPNGKRPSKRQTSTGPPQSFGEYFGQQSPDAVSVTVSSDAVSLDEKVFDMDEVRRFLKKSGCVAPGSDAGVADQNPLKSDSRYSSLCNLDSITEDDGDGGCSQNTGLWMGKPNEASEDREMAAVYRRIIKTLQGDRVRQEYYKGREPKRDEDSGNQKITCQNYNS